MNVRIDDEVKHTGDSVFADIGYTPTRVVDLVWRFAAANARDTKPLKTLLGQCTEALEAHEVDAHDKANRAVAARHTLLEHIQSQTAGLGAPSKTPAPPMTPAPPVGNAELREAAFEDRMREKGLL